MFHLLYNFFLCTYDHLSRENILEFEIQFHLNAAYLDEEYIYVKENFFFVFSTRRVL